MHVWEAISKTRASCFIGVSKHSKTKKALGLRPRAFISFLVFGNPDETLALVFEILLLKLINYSCSQKPINDLHLGQVDESWYPNETPDETPPGVHLRWNMFFIWDQTFLIVSFEKTCQKLGLRASSRVPNTSKQMKALGLLTSVSRCLEPMMKHSPSFLTYYVNNHTDNVNGVTFVTPKLMSLKGPIFTKYFEIRKYQTFYWNVNMKAHWRGFTDILNPKAVFPFKSYRLTQHVCQSNYHDCRNLPVNSLKLLFS